MSIEYGLFVEYSTTRYQRSGWPKFLEYVFSLYSFTLITFWFLLPSLTDLTPFYVILMFLEFFLGAICFPFTFVLVLISGDKCYSWPIFQMHALCGEPDLLYFTFLFSLFVFSSYNPHHTINDASDNPTTTKLQQIECK